MTDRSDRKLQQVPLASYNYRHEAEFAAGFLQDAGIPFRLQIEDPTLGLSATNSATIWVAAMDERRAHQVLNHELATSEDEEELAEEGPWSAMDPEEDAADTGAAGRDVRAAPPTDMAGSTSPGAMRRNSKPDLTLRQRVIALGGGVGVSALLGIEALREAPTAVSMAVALVAVILALAGVFGWAPGPLRRLLGALSGDAP